MPDGVRVQAKPPGGVARRFLRASAAGRGDTAELTVEDEHGGFTIRYPERDDLSINALVRVVDVAVAMRRRFWPGLRHTRRIFVDHGTAGFQSGRTAGEAMPVIGDIHLNATFFLGDNAAPNQVEETTAHEFWHQVELAFQAERYRESMEFRRFLGAYFGEETLEHVVARPGRARDRLIAEVSAYAATNALEAAAEMARIWWRYRVAVDRPPIVSHFDDALARYFPPP